MPSQAFRRLLAATTVLAATAATAAPALADEPAPAPAPAPAPTAPTVVVVTPPSSAPVAAAQPSPPAPPAPPAPQTHDWKDVSNINGQLVPVGEKNSYLYKYRRTNISTNPIGWMLGFYGVSVSYGLNDHIAIRGDVNYMRPFDGAEEGVELGVGVPIYFRRTYQGPFLEPGLITRTFHFNDVAYADCIDCSSGTSTTYGPQMLVGWHWTWDSGLNIAVAAGFGRNWAIHDTGSSYAAEKIFGNGYMRFGYAF
jgi:Protein of unknown function (DUF3575)